MTDLRYPVGRLEAEKALTPERRGELIEQIEEAPARLREAVAGLSPEQLDTPYRPGGWTVRQVIHHLPDSHLNAYVRCKLALTEDVPTVKTYEEARWAELPDSRSVPIAISLALLDALHRRWVALLRVLPAADFQKTFRHPDMGLMTVDELLGVYSWHGRHHVAHVTALRERMGWR
jgi:uncharacterized damage-inducible protein DinB